MIEPEFPQMLFNGRDACLYCGKPHLISDLPKRVKYSGIDDAGDDVEDWMWYRLNGRCVQARRLKASEAESYQNAAKKPDAVQAGEAGK